jgi:tetratricopeptide (TPR) repeat protein
LPYWNKSVELLEKAISLHKDNKEYWHKLVNAYLNLDDESAAQKTIERAAQTVTDIPEFLILAANLALKKSAYDKGLRYINQAIELDPLNIEIRQTEAKLLCGKAQKRIGQKKITEAVALYQKAVNINQLPVEERAIFESELAALYVYAKRENDTLQLYQKSPIAHSVPWIWVYSHIQGLKRLGTLFAPKSKKTSKNIPSNMLLGPIPFSEEKAPPSEQELNVMLSLWFEEPGQSKLVLEYQILLSAILAGYNQIKQKKYLKYLVDFMNRSENQEKQFLTIAEYANEMAPNEFEIVLYRYEAARHFKKSKSYFVNAEQELHEALEQYSEDSTNISFMPTFDRNHFYRILRFSRLIEFINNDCQEETKKAKSKSKKKYGNSIY